MKLTGIMCPPTLYPSLSLMAIARPRTGRGWMELDSDLPEPPLTRILALLAGVALFLVWAAILQGQGA